MGGWVGAEIREALGQETFRPGCRLLCVHCRLGKDPGEVRRVRAGGRDSGGSGPWRRH